MLRAKSLGPSLLILGLLVLGLSAGVSSAQPPSLDFGNLGNDLPDFEGVDSQASELTLTGTFHLQESSRKGRLEIHAKAQKGWHTYSLTQVGGPGPSKLTVMVDPALFTLAGPFTADRKPYTHIVKFDDGKPVWPEPVEEFEEVIWSAPIELTAAADPENVTIRMIFDGQVCSDTGGCIELPDVSIKAKYKADRRATEVSDKHVTITGKLDPDSVQAGDTAKLVITATPAEGWHLYPHGVTMEEAGGTPTSIVLRQVPGLTFGKPQASSAPIAEKGQLYHEGEVSWTIDVQVADNIGPGKLDLEGVIEYQVCTASSCDPPATAKLHASLQVQEDAVTPTPVAVGFSTPGSDDLGLLEGDESGAGKEVKSESKQQKNQASVSTASTDFWTYFFKRLEFKNTEQGWVHPSFESTYFSRSSLIVVATILALIMALLGGLILNVMPCVLPVIGLKIMSFIQQAGESRKRVFVLNVWYSLGVWSIFLIFAVLAAILHFAGQTFAWGEHLGDPRFAIPLLSVVFVLGLSMFGVWEIPIPGFVGSNKASELSQKEGPPGAFFKGALTTILATPCSGPFIGVVVGAAVIAPIWLNFALFTTMAIGMACPFLIIGAFPKLMKWLPKPGAWMDTVKQFMGFVLMATCVWIIYFIEDRFVIPAIALMIGLGIACWMVGRIPATAERPRKVRGWLWATVIGGCAVIVFARMIPEPVEKSESPISAASLSRDSPELPWQKFTRERLEKYRAQGKTVFVDFTADW